MPDPVSKIPVAILISGRGSNMVALLDAMADPAFPARCVLVVSNRPKAEGLAKAAARSIPTAVLDHKAYPSREAFDADLHDALSQSGAQWVCLAGFMRILTPDFVARWAGRMLNIHPSLLPKYPGLDTHQRALNASDAEAGCTVHLVTPDLDAGPILGQARVPILPGDDADTLAARVVVEEHRLYPQCLRAVLADARIKAPGSFGPDRHPTISLRAK